jgi:hypothetical protein
MVVPPVLESFGVFFSSIRSLMPSSALVPCQSNHFTSREIMTRFVVVQPRNNALHSFRSRFGLDIWSRPVKSIGNPSVVLSAT